MTATTPMKSVSSWRPRPGLLGLIALLIFNLTPAAMAQTNAEILAEMGKMKARIAELEAKLAATQQTANEAEEKATAATEAVQTVATAAIPSAKSMEGVEDTLPAGEIPLAEEGWWNRTSLGGYGEMHLTLGDDEQIDFHRY